MIIVSSDWHLNPIITPERLARIEEHLDYLASQYQAGATIILPGDIEDRLEFPDYRMPEDIANKIKGSIRLRGNHDNDKSLPLCIVLGDYYFCHGHQFELLWKLPIYKIPLPPCLVKLYKTPAQKKGELLDYHLSTLHVEYEATRFCVKNYLTGIIFGHTHSPVIIQREGFTLANAGDFVDSFTWLEGDTETNKWRLVK